VIAVAQSAPIENRQVLGFANLFEMGRRAPIWEQGVITVWFFVTYVPLDSATPIRYALIAYFLGMTFLFYREVVPLILQSWPLFLLPAFAMLSFTWSAYPQDAMRLGVLMMLTPLTIVVIAARMNTRQVLRCLMFAGILAAVYAAPEIDTFAWGGPYASKNYLAIQMLFAMVLSLSAALNPNELKWVRIVALPFVPICFYFLYLANSATSLVFAIIGIVGLIGFRYSWMGFDRVRHLRTILALVAALVALMISIVILNLPENTFVSDFLGLLGKDSTLSGRTALWREAALVSEEHPIFGVGLEGFWQYDVGAAQTLNENDFKAFGTKLSFHNVYWEVRVHLGYIGLALFDLILAWCLYRTLSSWFRAPTLENSVLVVTAAIILTSTFTESVLWGTFNTPVNLFYFGAITSMGAGRRIKLGQVPLLASTQSSSR
jgi:exopolysaccharide production protein ExoQ